MSGKSAQRQREGLQTVQKLLDNIRMSPAEVKFRQVKRSNPSIQQRLFPECQNLLKAAGFEETADLLVYSGDPAPEFFEVLAVVESLLLSLGGGSASSSSSSSSAPAPFPEPITKAPAEVKKLAQQQKTERARQETQRSQATAQEQLSALRKQRAGQYQQQQDVALATHLSSRAADMPYDPITALNASRGANYSFVSCTRCGASLRYNAATRAQAVLCPCGMLLQPIAMRGQAFAPQSPSDLPVEPGEPVDSDNRPRTTRGPFINVRGPDGQNMLLPLHSVLQMQRQYEARQMAGAQEDTIEALPTRTYTAALRAEGAKKEDTGCQICMEDFAEGDELRTLPCFHLFHAKCVDQWLKVNSICPTCRHKVG